jgi:hypothetical protein
MQKLGARVRGARSLIVSALAGLSTGCSGVAVGDSCPASTCAKGSICFELIECRVGEPSLACCNGVVGEIVECSACEDFEGMTYCRADTSSISICGETFVSMGR